MNQKLLMKKTSDIFYNTIYNISCVPYDGGSEYPYYKNVSKTQILFPDNQIYTVINVGKTNAAAIGFIIYFDKNLPDIKFNVRLKALDTNTLTPCIEGYSYKYPPSYFGNNCISFRANSGEDSFVSCAYNLNLNNISKYNLRGSVSNKDSNYYIVNPSTYHPFDLNWFPYSDKKVNFELSFIKTVSWY